MKVNNCQTKFIYTPKIIFCLLCACLAFVLCARVRISAILYEWRMDQLEAQNENLTTLRNYGNLLKLVDFVGCVSTCDGRLGENLPIEFDFNEWP